MREASVVGFMPRSAAAPSRPKTLPWVCASAAVMLSRQQASIGFEATLQVRNKLLSAYKDIMSMPV